jgi:stearoyl-CoA desaturase (delta-9 desaturase)
MVRWFDTDAPVEREVESRTAGICWRRSIPYILIHLVCFGVIWVGWSWVAVGTAVGLYVVRMFAITGFYHRYFSHRTYNTSRFWQFLFALAGNSSAQRGPLWWAAHHRHHHRFADREEDVHSPARHGFVWSHIGWLTSPSNLATRQEYVSDWAEFPELRLINRFDKVVPILLAVSLYVVGDTLAKYVPEWGTNAPQMLIWGFFISTVVLLHGTCTINSLDHMVGTRRYDTPDTSRNNVALALITLGEGWHNNHHRYPISARQGFFWWELDLTHYGLVLMSRLGIVRDLRPVPKRVRKHNNTPKPAEDQGTQAITSEP